MTGAMMRLREASMDIHRPKSQMEVIRMMMMM